MEIDFWLDLLLISFVKKFIIANYTLNIVQILHAIHTIVCNVQ